MRIERTPVEPEPAAAEAARQQILDALAVIYPGWEFTSAVCIGLAPPHFAHVACAGTAYNNPAETIAVLHTGVDFADELQRLWNL